MRVKMILLAAVLTAVFAGPAGSQETKGVVVFEGGEGGVEIVSLLEFIGENSGQSLVYDPNAPQIRGRKVALKGRTEIPADKVFAWGQALLFFHRIVLVPNGPRETGQWLVVDLNSPSVCTHPEYVPFEELSNWKDRDGAFIVTTIPAPRLADTSRARNALAQLSTRQVGRVNDVPGSRSFVVGDFAPVVCAMSELLARMEDGSEKADMAAAKESESLSKQLEKCEQMLMNARTETAARYFETRVNAIRTKLEAAD